jgi:hypothetical protein
VPLTADAVWLPKIHAAHALSLSEVTRDIAIGGKFDGVRGIVQKLKEVQCLALCADMFATTIIVGVYDFIVCI